MHHRHQCIPVGSCKFCMLDIVVIRMQQTVQGSGKWSCCHLAHVEFIGAASRVFTMSFQCESSCVNSLCGLFAGLARSAASFWGGRAGTCKRCCRMYAIHSSLPQGMRYHVCAQLVILQDVAIFNCAGSCVDLLLAKHAAVCRHHL